MFARPPRLRGGDEAGRLLRYSVVGGGPTVCLFSFAAAVAITNAVAVLLFTLLVSAKSGGRVLFSFADVITEHSSSLSSEDNTTAMSTLAVIFSGSAFLLRIPILVPGLLLVAIKVVLPALLPLLLLLLLLVLLLLLLLLLLTAFFVFLRVRPAEGCLFLVTIGLMLRA